MSPPASKCRRQLRHGVGLGELCQLLEDQRFFTWYAWLVSDVEAVQDRRAGHLTICHQHLLNLRCHRLQQQVDTSLLRAAVDPAVELVRNLGVDLNPLQWRRLLAVRVVDLCLTNCQVPPPACHARQVSHHRPAQMDPVSRLERACRVQQFSKRVQCAPLRLEDKVQLVTGAASSLANYGLETCFIGESALARVRSAVVMAIWNHRRRFRSSHAVLLLFTQSHLTDPFHAQVYQCLTTLKRCLSQNPAVRAIWEPWWLKASGHDPRRPRGPVTLLCNVVRRIKWSWVSAWTLRTHQYIDLDLLNTDSDLFAHHVREACRVHGWQQALGLHKHFE